MRVAVVTEAFLPSINGVTNSVLRILEHLRRTGHDAVVIAPRDPRGMPGSYADFPVIQTQSVTLPWYKDLRLAVPSTAHIEKLLVDVAPDVVHLASPILLGHKGVIAASRLGIPSVALYQTEVASYATHYGYSVAQPLIWHHLRKIHNMATINLAPSTYTRDSLVAHGFSRVGVWGRGVDTARFHPNKRDEQLHAQWAPNGEIVVGYMGRLGPEKRVGDLSALADIPGSRLVIIGDGPMRAELADQIPGAIFVGMKKGEDLPRHLASVDLFVHPGELETFGQPIQEAQACGLPAIAPRRGGPIDLIEPSHNGWLYSPGDLATLRHYVTDLVGDDYKRTAFGRTARTRVEQRTWPRICAELMGHYGAAVRLGAKMHERIA